MISTMQFCSLPDYYNDCFFIFIWINSAPIFFFAIENGSEKPQKNNNWKEREKNWMNECWKKSVQIGSSGVDIEAVYH